MFIRARLRPPTAPEPITFISSAVRISGAWFGFTASMVESRKVPGRGRCRSRVQIDGRTRR